MNNIAQKKNIRDRLQANHSEAELQTWFDPLNLRFADAGTLEVCFPHVLFSRWFDKERRKAFEREIYAALEGHPRIVYAQPAAPRTKEFASVRNAYREIRAKQKNFPETTGEQWSFETFLYNKKNEFAVVMAMEAASQPQNPSHVPLIIAGKGTCGKTHLLRAMARKMTATLFDANIFFGTVAELHSYFSECRDSTAFRRKISRKKAIFIDNAQDLAEYPELQQELVFLTDSFKDKNKPLVLSVDTNFNPQSLDRGLYSRISGGLILTLKIPDLDIRLRYGKAQCAAMRLHLEKEHLLFIAQRFHNIRAIQGIIAKIAAYGGKTGRPVSSAELQKIIAGADTLSLPQATPEAVIRHVAEAMNISPEEITGNSRRADIVKARQTAMYLCREFLQVSLAALGKYFTGKNHATVIYACKKIENILDSDSIVNNLVTQARKKFLSL